MFKSFKARKCVRQALAFVLSFVMVMSNFTTLPVSAETINDTNYASVTTYDFRDGSIVPTDTDGKATVTSADGKLTVACGPNNAYQYNGEQHGVAFKTGNTITISVDGSADIYLGGCSFSNETATVSLSAGSEVLTTVGTKTAACYASDGSNVKLSYVGEATDLVLAFTNTSYVPVILVAIPENVAEPTTSPVPTEEPTTTSAPTEEPTVEYDPNKIDVWDFGAEQLDADTYNNMLTVDIINSWYPGVEPGTKGPTLASFVCGDIAFNDGGFSATHRYRTSNTALTRYDEKTKKGADGTVYNGFIYSNKGSSPDVNMTIDANAGDIVTFLAGSNSSAAVYAFKAPSGEIKNADFTNTSQVEPITFYVVEDGIHTLYCTNEKLVVARIYREHTADVAVTGNVTAPEELADYSVAFINTKTGAQTTASVENGSYAVTLKDNYDYEVALVNANGYIITSDASLSLAKGTEQKLFDITVEAVSMVTLSGSIVGLDEEALAKAEFKFSSEEIYVPQMTISGNEYTVQLEKGVTYTLSVAGINDYQFVSSTTICGMEDVQADITLEKKPVYAVTINPQGAAMTDLTEAEFTFTNLNEEGYSYTFKGDETMALRDGVYSVKVSNSGIYVQKLTSNVKVNGSAVTKNIGFESHITKWEFTGEDYTGQAAYNGLAITGSFGKHGAQYGMQLKNASIVVPVSGECDVNVAVGYNWDISFDDGEVAYFDNTNSGDITVTYSFDGSADSVTINAGSQCTSYIKWIEVVEKCSYKPELTVGASGCDYTTISDALAAVKKMTRENNERVTILVQPGNYEEMLVVDVPNVTLKNASATPSIELKNKGVDIDENAVRVTHYYGHGYTYYSMGSDCKYDEEILAVNKENGYPSFENPGSGTTAGSYWNATVVVTANGFEAEGIIFENSFNQYVSAKAANDVIVAQSGAKEGSVPRASMVAGDTTVQQKAYVERAAALAIYNNVKQTSFDNCKFIGRQDTLYGGTGVTAAFYDCAIYGGTDYIFGGMNAVFAKCDLVFNTSEDKNDLGYITAAQTKSGRGMLLYNCHVTSTVPGVDTASELPSKPGYLGRPWQAGTGEAVFYNTVIDATCTDYYEKSASLIMPAGWDKSLSGESVLSAEYGTYEMAKDVDNQASRVAWATTLNETTGPVLSDGTTISVEAFLGDWDAFAGKDMEIVLPTEKVDNAPAEEEPEGGSATTEFVLETSALEAVAQGAKADGDTQKAGTEDYFTIIYSSSSKVDNSNKTFEDSYASSQRLNLGGAVSTEKNAVKFTTSNPATVKVWWVEGGDDNRQMAILNASGAQVAVTDVTLARNATCISTFELAEAGTYYLGSSPKNNYIFRVLVTEEKAAEPVVSTLESSALNAFAVGAKTDGASEEAGTNGYFTLVYSAKSKVDSSSKSFDDGYSSGQRINFGGAVATDKNAVMFKTENPSTVKVWWVEGGDDNRQMAILNASGAQVAVTDVTLARNATCISTFELAEAGTYFLGGATNNNYIFKVEVTETPSGLVKPERADWASVQNAEIVSAVVNAEDANKIDVTVNANVSYNGADKLTVTMKDADGKVVATANSLKEATEHTLTFTGKKSGTYTFEAVLIRDGEEDKISAKTVSFDFTLPLVAPYVSSATNVGGGSVSVEWQAVPEAEKYVVTVDGTEISIGTTLLSSVVTGLTVGETYTIKVVAVRGEDTSAAGSIKVNVVDEVQRKWSFSAYGSSTNDKNNGYIGNINDGSVTVYSEGGKGKIVPASTDGLAFYYTAMDPETENFTLTATVTVDKWKLSNGQEGFGIMAADTVGQNGDATEFWNNVYQNVATKIEYYHDGENVTTDSSANKISMKLGLGTIAKTGATIQGVADKFAGKVSIPPNFVSESSTLETSGASMGAGTYNLIGNYEEVAPEGCVDNLLTTFRMQIQRNNTGYILRYLDADDNVLAEKLYYDLERTSLTQLDEDNIYVGFFASRNARITVTDVELTTIHPDDDAPAEEREIEYVYPVNTVESATFANSADYEFVYYGNADGHLTVTDAAGKKLIDTEFKALSKEKKTLTLEKGKNTFDVTFVPDADYKPGEYKEMTSYETVTIKHVVEYKTSNRDVIYVSPNGKTSGNGSKNNPMDIYSAVKVVAPGQTILVMEGTYNLKSTVKVERGINGTADKMIYMIADPDAKTRPVFDFGGACAGMVLAGDYWYFQGFDVTRSANAQKGVQVSGNHNVLDGLRTYRNGNTGIQISRYMGTDEYNQWPSYNTILNCTSYLNADAGYEDADGFAAKLTVGDGNVFDGCIAAYNADDGWDLFAKVQTGSIGVVTIKNSVAFKNGYDIDANGNEKNAGNGNGFKMGGDSMPGAHVLENSIAFANKAKGIDSNSGPNIRVYNCTSFDNESYNVAFYTNTAVNTAYYADGVLSYKKSNSVAEQIKQKGTQVETDIYGVTNYYFDGSASANTAGAKVSDAWFENLDTAAAITGITRNADGTINMNGFLELTDAADAKAGARMSGTASGDVEVEIPEEPIATPIPSPDVDDDDDDDNKTESTPAPEASAAPQVTEAPQATREPLPMPEVTPAPLPTKDPIQPEKPQVDKEEAKDLIVEVAGKIVDGIEKLAQATTKEEAQETVKDVLESIKESWETSEVSKVVTDTLKELEKSIAKQFGTKTEVKSQSAPKQIAGFEISNALLSVPAGEDAVIEIKEAEVPSKPLPSDLKVAKVENAVAFELDLFSSADTKNKVQLSAPVVVSFDVPAEVDQTKAMGLIHYMDNGDVEVIPVTLDENGKAVATIRSFSVFVLANVELSDVPVENTAIGSAISVPEAIVDAQADQNMPWLPIAVAAVIGVAVVAIAVAMLRKKQEEM